MTLNFISGRIPKEVKNLIEDINFINIKLMRVNGCKYR